MMRRSLISFCLILTACSDVSAPTPPEGLISKEKIVPLMVDLKVLEQHFHRLYLRPEAYAAALDSSSFYVFESYGVTREEFRSSLNYYSRDADTIFAIFESALDTINLRVSAPGVGAPVPNPMP